MGIRTYRHSFFSADENCSVYFDLSGALMKEVSSRSDGAFQLLITRWVVSGSVWSRTLFATNLGASFGSVLGVHSLADATDMRTFDTLGSTSKTTFQQ